MYIISFESCLFIVCYSHPSTHRLPAMTLSQAYRPSEIFWIMGLSCLILHQNIKQLIMLQENTMMTHYRGIYLGP